MHGCASPPSGTKGGNHARPYHTRSYSQHLAIDEQWYTRALMREDRALTAGGETHSVHSIHHEHRVKSRVLERGFFKKTSDYDISLHPKRYKCYTYASKQASKPISEKGKNCDFVYARLSIPIPIHPSYPVLSFPFFRSDAPSPSIIRLAR